MAARETAQRTGGVLSRLAPPVRFALAAGLLALGIGDLAAINLVLLPRHFAGDPGVRELPLLQTRPVVAPAPVAAVPAPAAAPVVSLPAVEEPVAPVAPAPLAPPAEASQEAAGEDFADLLFARNALWLSPASRETLSKLAEALMLDPERRVVLSGHADTVGDPEFNRWLSFARARRARHFLQAKGVERARIEVKSFGSARPVEGEPVSGVRARNRRVEIAVY